MPSDRDPRPAAGGPFVLLIALLCGSAASIAPVARADEGPRVATFRLDITPPSGSPLCGGWIKPLEGVDDPLLAKGIVLDDGGRRYVLCALDWCEVRNGAHDLLRAELAAAAGTEPSCVAVQCVHQHNAPLIDTAAQTLLDMSPAPLALIDAHHFAETTKRLTAVVAEALERLEPFDQVALGSARVEEIASTRRIPLPDGAVRVRYSSAPDPELRALPEGLIDPLLRTITLLAGERPLVRLHYYATHPQSYYGDGRASSEFPGLAREALEAEEQVPQIYFTGCAGNVAAGKYNDGSPAARVALTERMAAAMRASIAASQVEPVGEVTWRTTLVHFKPRDDGPYNALSARSLLADTAAGAQQRLKASLVLSFHARAEQPIELSALAIGSAKILHLPGEPFVEYQLLAQQLDPQAFVAVAGYGDGGPGYLCTHGAFSEGGYEPTSSHVVAESEAELRAAIARLLGVE